MTSRRPPQSHPKPKASFARSFNPSLTHQSNGNNHNNHNNHNGNYATSPQSAYSPPKHASSGRRSITGVHDSTVKTLTQMRMSQQQPCHHFDVDDDLSTFRRGTNRKKSKILRKPLPGPVAFMSTEEEERNGENFANILGIPGSQISVNSQAAGTGMHNSIHITADKVDKIPYLGNCWKRACTDLGRPTFLPTDDQTEEEFTTSLRRKVPGGPNSGPDDPQRFALVSEILAGEHDSSALKISPSILLFVQSVECNIHSAWTAWLTDETCIYSSAQGSTKKILAWLEPGWLNKNEAVMKPGSVLAFKPGTAMAFQKQHEYGATPGAGDDGVVRMLLVMDDTVSNVFADDDDLDVDEAQAFEQMMGDEAESNFEKRMKKRRIGEDLVPRRVFGGDDEGERAWGESVDDGSRGIDSAMKSSQDSQNSKNKSEVRILLDLLKEDELLQNCSVPLFPKAKTKEKGGGGSGEEVSRLTDPPPKIMKVQELLSGLIENKITT
ncbi:hypothetical protein TrVE_jg6520 [Triparma verrucosa]|uniref:Uncharacterized protein n=1 Tax=Triparma verrucosa TaxID=1606542 RepID=A0A9W7FGT6_9STRA|nr:hypothetical protein TrVE_jg6520 [Triparma verrucosa]